LSNKPNSRLSAVSEDAPRPELTGVAREGTYTGTAPIEATANHQSIQFTSTTLAAPVAGEMTGTIVAPLEAGELPDVASIRGMRLDQILLITTGLLVLLIVGGLTVASFRYNQDLNEQTAQRIQEQLQSQARELGQTVSHTLALTSTTSLRDNNYGFLTEVAREITEDNPNILRVQMFDAEGQLVADSDKEAKLGVSSGGRKAERGVTSAFYKNQAIFEFQEPLDYGSQVGKGLIVISYSLDALQRQMNELDENTRATLGKTTVFSLGLGGGFLVLAMVLVAVQSSRITRPLSVLTRKVMQLAAGDLNARSTGQAAGAGREVRTLGVVFNHMAERIKVLLEDVRVKAQLEREMSLARTVQETLSPGREALQVGPLRIAGLVVTADACGGDWWFRAPLDEQRVAIGIGDVTGHGLSTALVATSATSGFASAMTMREPDQLNSQVLISALNITLAHLGRSEYQMSSALAVIDTQTGFIDYAAGGHPAAAVYNKVSGQFASLPARGPLLGASVTSQYTSRQAQLRPGDIVVWYSDGLTESRDAGGKLYGTQRLSAAIQANAQLSAEGLRDAILADVRAFSAGQPQRDDITVVVAEFSPAS
jgi:sigma-B regulation protein RsbU (phosphoserine phosphatase)